LRSCFLAHRYPKVLTIDLPGFGAPKEGLAGIRSGFGCLSTYSPQSVTGAADPGPQLTSPRRRRAFAPLGRLDSLCCPNADGRRLTEIKRRFFTRFPIWLNAYTSEIATSEARAPRILSTPVSCGKSSKSCFRR